MGTGLPRLMTITVDTCVGPRAYTGMASPTTNRSTNGFERLTDERWTQQLNGGQTPTDVPWMQSLVAE